MNLFLFQCHFVPGRSNWNSTSVIHDFLCLRLCMSFCACSCVCIWVHHVCVFVTLTACRSFFFIACRLNDRGKRRFSKKVNRVERERYPSQKPLHFFGHLGYLLIFLWRKKKRLSVGKLAARLGPTWHILCRHWEENRKPRSKQTDWAKQLERLCLEASLFTL